MPEPIKYCLYVREDLASLKPSFFDAAELYGMKTDLYMYKELRAFLQTKNIHLDTQNIHSPEDSEVVICVNETGYFQQYRRSTRNRLLVLILTEPPVYNRQDWDPESHRMFDKIFTYNADLVKKDESKYIHLAYPIDFNVKKPEAALTQNDFLKKKHSCMISAAFAITTSRQNRGSLLYERYEVLRWYHRNAPDQLDYYARTEPEQKFLYFRGASLINRINPGITNRIATRSYRKNLAKLYKGPVPGLDKNRVLGTYKFNFCFENSAGLKGYITEKIFDCFFSNTVPVYYGASDIEQYIPKNCFISFTDFSTIGALQKYLAGMDYNRYIQYLNHADDFLRSPAAGYFSTDEFIQTLYRATRI
jgi:hypothetical protein